MSLMASSNQSGGSKSSSSGDDNGGPKISEISLGRYLPSRALSFSLRSFNRRWFRLSEAENGFAPSKLALEADLELEEAAWVKEDHFETRLGGPSGSAAGLEEATHSQAPPEADPELEEAARVKGDRCETRVTPRAWWFSIGRQV